MRASPSAGIGLQSMIQQGGPISDRRLKAGHDEFNLLESSISPHLILQATYRGDKRFPLLQLCCLVRQVCQFVVHGIHAIYDAGKNHGPSLYHGLIAINRLKALVLGNIYVPTDENLNGGLI